MLFNTPQRCFSLTRKQNEYAATQLAKLINFTFSWSKLQYGFLVHAAAKGGGGGDTQCTRNNGQVLQLLSKHYYRCGKL